MLRLSVLHPAIRSGTFEPGFGCNHEIGRVRIERLSHKTFTHLRTIGVGGVDKVDAEFDGSPNYANHLIMVLGFSPYALAGDSHRAKSKPVDGQLSSNKEFAGLRCGFDAGSLFALDLYRFLLRSHNFSSKALCFTFRLRCGTRVTRFVRRYKRTVGPTPGRTHHPQRAPLNRRTSALKTTRY